MKTIQLTSNEIAIKTNVIFFITKDEMIRGLADLAHSGEITYPLTKKEIIIRLKSKFKHKGYSVYCDYFEDTGATELWNKCVEDATKVVEKLFPELTPSQSCT